MQRNEGRWDFSLEESDDRNKSSLVLEVDVGKFLDTSLIQADVQPEYIRWVVMGVGWVTGNQPTRMLGHRQQMCCRKMLIIIVCCNTACTSIH
jgi:hypothetical protein